MDNNFTQNLNENQLHAVMHKNGPALIIAGPGSGKTRVITSRIAWLINIEKIPMQEIAALTFTNKAANEMKNRIFHMLDIPPIKFLPNIGTFHSFCAYLIREKNGSLYIRLPGKYSPACKVIKSADSPKQSTIRRREKRATNKKGSAVGPRK